MLGPTPDMKNQFRGCLVGCAVGDSLGAPFEGYVVTLRNARRELSRARALVNRLSLLDLRCVTASSPLTHRRN
jgi:hypothetical protein